MGLAWHHGQERRGLQDPGLAARHRYGHIDQAEAAAPADGVEPYVLPPISEFLPSTFPTAHLYSRVLYGLEPLHLEPQPPACSTDTPDCRAPGGGGRGAVLLPVLEVDRGNSEKVGLDQAAGCLLPLSLAPGNQ